MKGIGTDEDVLIRVLVSRSEVSVYVEKRIGIAYHRLCQGGYCSPQPSSTRATKLFKTASYFLCTDICEGLLI